MPAGCALSLLRQSRLAQRVEPGLQNGLAPGQPFDVELGIETASFGQSAVASDPEEDRSLCHPLGAPQVQAVGSGPKGGTNWFDRLRRVNPTLFAHRQLCHGNGRTSAPYESRDSRTDLGAPGVETPSGRLDITGGSHPSDASHRRRRQSRHSAQAGRAADQDLALHLPRHGSYARLR